ncbi:hypothetical protein BDR05DRAFT_953255 [Suillus weaverae]|nr:hypothetical protein BDR05DRAFT_953255 [Suillus weaverae]
MDGKVQRTLMDCVLFMKNLPPSIEVLDSPGSPPCNSLTPQPSSPLVWSPSPPCRDHRKVVPLPCPIPTKVPPCQPLLQKGVVMHTSNPRLMSRMTRPAPVAPVKSRKVAEVPLVRKHRRDESDAIIPMTISSSIACSTVPLNNLIIVAHHHLFAILVIMAMLAPDLRSDTNDEEELEVEDGGYDHDYFKDYE